MAIIKVKSHVDSYKIKSKARHIHELSGRRHTEMTHFRNEVIRREVELSAGDAILDIGCGDGSLLQSLMRESIDATGTAPNEEEVTRLQETYVEQERLRFKQALATSLPFEDQSFRFVICNGVLLLLPTKEDVHRSLQEIARVLTDNGTAFIGEIPDCDEFIKQGQVYGDSIVKWILFTFRTAGWKAGMATVRRVLRAIFTDEHLVINPKKMTYFSPEEMAEYCQSIGLQVKQVNRSPVWSEAGQDVSPTRYDYIVVKQR